MKVELKYLMYLIRFVHLWWFSGGQLKPVQLMKYSVTTLLVLILAVNISAQVNKYGTATMESYSAQTMNGSDFTHSIVKDKKGNMYFANEDMGIIRYNGSNWRTIPVRNNALIRAMAVDENGIIYAGGKFEFGYVAPDDLGVMTYFSLSQRIDEQNERVQNDSSVINPYNDKSEVISLGQVLSLVIVDSNAYYLSDDGFFIYNIPDDSLRFIDLKKSNLAWIVKIFEINGKIILGDFKKGLLSYDAEKDTILALPGGDFFIEKRCLSMMPYDSTSVVAGTLANGIVLYNYSTGEIKKDFCNSALNKKLSADGVYNGTSIPSGDFAFGTMMGGIYIIDRSGTLIQHWDKDNSGLHDNGIYSIYCDNGINSVLWIATSRYITKAYINLPFKEFSLKSGIDGAVNNITEFNGDIYVATDYGVFKSVVDDESCRRFVKLPVISLPVYYLCPVKIDRQEFLMAGTLLGIYQIGKNDGIVKLENIRDGGKERVSFDVGIRIITQSKINRERFYIGSEENGIYILEYHSGTWRVIKRFKEITGSITGIAETKTGDVIFSTDFSNSLFKLRINDTIQVPYGPEKGAPYASIFSFSQVGDDLILCTGKGYYKYVDQNDSWIPYNDATNGLSEGKETVSIIRDNDGDIWAAFLDNKKYTERLFTTKDDKPVGYFGALAFLPNVKNMDLKCLEGKVWVAKSNNVYVIEKKKLFIDYPSPNPLISKIHVGSDSLLLHEEFYKKLPDGRNIPLMNMNEGQTAELKFTLNSVSFYWTLPFYTSEQYTLFSYRLDGFDTKWSDWDILYYKEYTNLPYGHYSFRIKARTVTGNESTEGVYNFIVLKPWYLRLYMVILYAFCIVLIIYGITKAYTRKLKNENTRLEGIVAERTAVVVKQKDELESSIHYASRIQMALLPSENVLAENLKNYFILFRPRDIVSGDFYWMTKRDNRLYIVAADCTGHGVPGAFMSILGMSFLDEIIDKDKYPPADQILSELRMHVIESLKQSGSDDEAKDGMDMALLVIDYNVSKIEFSGAYNPCFKVRKLNSEESRLYNNNKMEIPDGSMTNGKYLLETIYASKMPIGISARMDEKFVFYEWPLEKGISYYIFSDGYIDQFGGENGRKFMKKNFKRLILEIQDYPMKKQKDILEKRLKDWMGQAPQIDDILVVGIRTE
jgi:serine phosphatase RsbU (regulator of sigma subunit)/ligand-binding sensor domain-containing protein